MSTSQYNHNSNFLHILPQVLVKFPGEVVNNYADVFFLPLLTRLVNDEAAACRAAVAACLKLLLAALQPPQADAIAGYCADWLAGACGRWVLSFGMLFVSC